MRWQGLWVPKVSDFAKQRSGIRYAPSSRCARCHQTWTAAGDPLCLVQPIFNGIWQNCQAASGRKSLCPYGAGACPKKKKKKLIHFFPLRITSKWYIKYMTLRSCGWMCGNPHGQETKISSLQRLVKVHKHNGWLRVKELQRQDGCLQAKDSRWKSYQGLKH